MRAFLFSLIALGACATAHASERVTQSSAEIYGAAGCEDCGAGGCGAGGHFQNKGMGGWFGHMPQTCYSPRYGCYYGGNRHMHRYPAFHGTYYRRPYNYRNVFDYPWHAEMHEPTSLFSYNVGGEELGPAGGVPQPPAPVADDQFETAQRRQLQRLQAEREHMAARAAAAQRVDLTHPAARPASTLRR